MKIYFKSNKEYFIMNYNDLYIYSKRAQYSDCFLDFLFDIIFNDISDNQYY